MITGTRTAPLALPAEAYLSSQIGWVANTPAGTTVTVEFSRDGGQTWLLCGNGEPLPGLTAGDPLGSLDALLRQTLTSDDAAVTPTLSGLSVYVNVPPPGPAPQYDDSLPVFIGEIGDAQAIAGRVELTVESPLAQLQASFPRSSILPSCANSLYDGICALNRADFTEQLAVSAAATPGSIPIASAKAAGYYDLGKVTFTSGANAGLSRTIKQFKDGNLILAYPLDAVPEVGDTLDVMPGCDKTRAMCQAKFDNLVHFRGFPYVPDPSTQYAGADAIAPVMIRGPGQGSVPGHGGSKLGGLPNYKRRQIREP